MTLAYPFRCLNRYVGNAEAGSKKAHRTSSWIRKAVGEQVEELAKFFRLDGTKSGCQVLDVLLPHPACQRIVKSICHRSMRACLRCPVAGSNRHVVTLTQF